MLMRLLPGEGDLTPSQKELQAFAEGAELFERRAVRGEQMTELCRGDLSEEAISALEWEEYEILAAIRGWNTAFDQYQKLRTA